MSHDAECEQEKPRGQADRSGPRAGKADVLAAILSLEGRRHADNGPSSLWRQQIGLVLQRFDQIAVKGTVTWRVLSR